MNPISSKISDSMMRLMGTCYIEEKIGNKYEKDDEFKKMIKEMKQCEIRSLRRYYEAAKDDKEAMKEPFMEILMNVFEGKNEDIENARKLLEKHGYKVVK